MLWKLTSHTVTYEKWFSLQHEDTVQSMKQSVLLLVLCSSLRAALVPLHSDLFETQRRAFLLEINA